MHTESAEPPHDTDRPRISAGCSLHSNAGFQQVLRGVTLLAVERVSLNDEIVFLLNKRDSQSPRIGVKNSGNGLTITVTLPKPPACHGRICSGLLQG
jgi:hypothetical protein